MTFEVEQAFGELRSLVHGASSVRAFSAICCIAQQVEDHAPGVFSGQMLEYVRGHIRDWPVRHVTLRVPYAHAHAVGALVWAPLVRGVEVIEGFGDGLSAREYTERVTALGWCEYLRLDQFRVRPDVLLEAVDAGLFDGRRSVELWYMNMGDAALEGLIWRLSEREGTRGLEALRLTGCGVRRRTLAALWNSGLAARLRTLGLSHTRRLRAGDGSWEPGIEHVFGNLERFERLERLELKECALEDADVVALARAPAPASLRHVDLSGNAIGPDAIGAWVGEGRHAWWLDRVGRVTLDTSRWRFDEASLRACADSGLFDEVERWCAGYDGPPRFGARAVEAPFRTWAPLRERPQALACLRELDLRGVVVTVGVCEEVVEVLGRARLERLRLCPPNDVLFEAIVRSSGLERATHLHLSAHPRRHGERALRALLGWGRLGELEECDARFEVDAAFDAPLEGAPVVVERGAGSLGRRVVRVNHVRRAAREGACVDEGGSLRSGWMRRRAAQGTT